MTKIWFNIADGSPTVFDDDENMSNWPDFQETQPEQVFVNVLLDERLAALEATDVWALSDRTMTQDQIDYRQALRDITDHANWPNLAIGDWPIKPV
jgi:hypothetical protein